MEATYPKVIIYTDGSCLGNPGSGGYAALLFAKLSNGKVIRKEITGGEKNTTNNRMELTALCAALETLKGTCNVTVYTDSEYLEKNWTSVPLWKQRNWKGSSGQVKNADLWERFLQAVNKTHSLIQIEHVSAHTGIRFNEECDKIAKAQAKAFAIYEE